MPTEALGIEGREQLHHTKNPVEGEGIAVAEYSWDEVPSFSMMFAARVDSRSSFVRRGDCIFPFPIPFALNEKESVMEHGGNTGMRSGSGGACSVATDGRTGTEKVDGVEGCACGASRCAVRSWRALWGRAV